MRVRLSKRLGQHAAGSEHDVTDATGQRLIRKGAAERVKKTKPRRTKVQLEPKGKDKADSAEALHFAVEDRPGQDR